MKFTSKQKGLALLVFVTLMATAAATVTVKALNRSSQNTQIARDKITAAALAQAKEALIGYAITYGDKHQGEVHGYLPCPDIDGRDLSNNPAEGVSDLSCGNQNVSVIGRLPWKTLDLTPLRGGDNECLWYAVSGTYKYNPKTGLMNWDSNGQLQVYASDGSTLLTPADNQAVAVIFAPGTTAAGQDRSTTTASLCGGNYTASNYLDAVGTFNNSTVSAHTGANSAFRIGDHASPSGDKLIFISKQEIWSAMQKRNNFLATLDNLALKTAECIAAFGFHNNTSSNKSLPWPALLSPSNSNDYSINSNYNDIADTYSGRVPYRVNTSRSASTTGNTIPYPYYLLQADGTNCPVGWTNIYPWWNNWKDHLFYAISQKFKPDNGPTSSCDNEHCVQVNSTGNYAAIVAFANQKLSDQTRASSVTDSQRGVASNYLEGRNASNIANSHSDGNENYQTGATSSAFNDIIYCIKEDLSVVRGNAAGCP